MLVTGSYEHLVELFLSAERPFNLDIFSPSCQEFFTTRRFHFFNSNTVELLS
jgi:hypothetical protein